jgi:hypothetical protein
VSLQVGLSAASPVLAEHVLRAFRADLSRERHSIDLRKVAVFVRRGQGTRLGTKTADRNRRKVTFEQINMDGCAAG